MKNLIFLSGWISIVSISANADMIHKAYSAQEIIAASASIRECALTIPDDKGDDMEFVTPLIQKGWTPISQSNAKKAGLATAFNLLKVNSGGGWAIADQAGAILSVDRSVSDTCQSLTAKVSNNRECILMVPDGVKGDYSDLSDLVGAGWNPITETDARSAGVVPTLQRIYLNGTSAYGSNEDLLGTALVTRAGDVLSAGYYPVTCEATQATLKKMNSSCRIRVPNKMRDSATWLSILRSYGYFPVLGENESSSMKLEVISFGGAVNSLWHFEFSARIVDNIPFMLATTSWTDPIGSFTTGHDYTSRIIKMISGLGSCDQVQSIQGAK